MKNLTNTIKEKMVNEINSLIEKYELKCSRNILGQLKDIFENEFTFTENNEKKIIEIIENELGENSLNVIRDYYKDKKMTLKEMDNIFEKLFGGRSLFEYDDYTIGYDTEINNAGVICSFGYGAETPNSDFECYNVEFEIIEDFEELKDVEIKILDITLI